MVHFIFVYSLVQCSRSISLCALMSICFILSLFSLIVTIISVSLCYTLCFFSFHYSLCALLLTFVFSVSILYSSSLHFVLQCLYAVLFLFFLFYSHYYFSVYTLYSLFLLFSLCSLFLYAKFNHLWYLSVYFQFLFLCYYSVVH